GVSVHEEPRLLRVERAHEDRAVLPLPTSREIEEAAAVREKDGPAMRVLLAGFVELRHGTGLAPGVRDAEERAGWAGGKADDSLAVPGPAPSRRKHPPPKMLGWTGGSRA